MLTYDILLIKTMRCLYSVSINNMKKVAPASPVSIQGGYSHKLYDHMNAVLTAKPIQIVDEFGEEFINSLLQRCGLVEVK